MTNFSSPSCRSTRVTIVGAGNVGGTLAQRIAEKDLADVVLLDVLPGRPQGIALDLSQASGIEGHNRRIIGATDYTETHGSDIIVITAGLPRRPGMSRDDLMRTNAEIVTHAAKEAIAHSPDALIIVITNPLDAMTYLAWQASGLPSQRVMGMAGILDSTRFQTFIAMELGISPADVRAMVLGSHGDLMVPLPRYSTVNGIPIASLLPAEAIDRLIERTRNGGAEIVEQLKTGGAYYAPASSAYLMVEAILLNQPRILPIAAYLQGEYGLHDLYLGVPVKLGCGGVEQIIELELTQTEREGLEKSAIAVRESLSHVLSVS